MPLAHHVANQDPLAVGTKTMDLFVHSLKDCMPHLICQSACLLGDKVEHTGFDCLNMAKIYEVEPCRTLFGLASKCFRPVSDGFPTAVPQNVLIRGPLQGFPTGFRQVSDGKVSGCQLVSNGFPIGFRPGSRQVSNGFLVSNRFLKGLTIYEVLCVAWKRAT